MYNISHKKIELKSSTKYQYGAGDENRTHAVSLEG